MSIFTRLQGFLLKNNVIIGNIFSLGTLQIFNYIIPLITLPYILRVLGPEKYGTVAFIGALIGYCIILVNYGFNYTATKEVSIHRDDRNKISEIFCNVIGIKIIISIFALLVIFLLIHTFEIFLREYLIIIFSFLLVFGDVLFPIWLFQGMEQMKYITIINISIRTLFLLPIFFFINTPEDYIFLPLITSLTSIAVGIIAFILAIRLFHISFILPSRVSIYFYLREGWHIFISTVFISLYTTSTIFILGLFAPPAVVGYYASAEKLVRAFQGLIGPISQAIYPTIAKKLKVSQEKTIVFLKKLTILVSVSMFLISCFLFFGAEFLVKIIFGSQFEGSISIVRILSFLPLIVGINTIYSNLIMLNFGFQRAYSTIYVSVSILSVLLSLYLIYAYDSVGLAISVLFTECLLLVSVYIYLSKKGIRLI